jgi:putative tricarboxylic transport membrane protein
MPEIQNIIEKVGVIAHPTGPEQARKQMDDELASFGTIMKELGIIQ